jgi:hypothetical protein
VKTLHLASIFVLAAATTFACNDEGDRAPAGTAGSSGAAGKNGSAGNPSSAGNDQGDAGTGTAGTSGAGAGAGSSNDGGMGGGGAGGENQGGFDGGGAGAGGTGETDGGAGGEAGAGGAGGAPEVPDVVVPGPTELIGTWSTNFGGTEVITANTWNGANIVAYTSGVTVVYTRNPASAFFPHKFSKTVYTPPANDSFYFCQIVYNAETLAAAQADTKVADANALDTNGCSGFSWTKATKQ